MVQGDNTDAATEALARSELSDLVESSERKLVKVVVLSVLLAMIVGWLALEAPPGIAAGCVLVAILALKRAIQEYHRLASLRAELLGSQAHLAVGSPDSDPSTRTGRNAAPTSDNA